MAIQSQGERDRILEERRIKAARTEFARHQTLGVNEAEREQALKAANYDPMAALKSLQPAVAQRAAQAAADAAKREDQARISQAQGRIEAGQELAQSLIPEGSLGRIDENQVRQGRSADIADIIAQRKKIAEQGLAREEVQAERAKASEEINRQSETQRRRLAAIQATQGIRGGTATAQQSELLLQSLQARAGVERDLFLQSEQVKREALGQLEQSVSAAEASEASRQAARIQLQQFNLQQAAKERFGQVSTALGFAGMVSGDEASQRALEAARSQSTSVSGGK